MLLKKIFKIIAWVVAVAVALLLLNYAYFKYQVAVGDMVYYGDRWYTKSQLRKIIPPQYVDIPAKNTPEEVYANFRQALLNNQIDAALTYVRGENQASQRDALVKFGDLIALGNIYPEKIAREKIEGNFAQYKYSFVKDGNMTNSIILFEKDIDGYWKLDI